MSKIIQAMNKIIEKSDSITKVQFGADDKEIFFEYEKTHAFSISNREDDIYFFIYTGENSVEHLMATEPHEWEYVSFSTFQKSTFKEKEERDTFNALYKIVREKVITKVDSILNQIIGI